MEEVKIFTIQIPWSCIQKILSKESTKEKKKKKKDSTRTNKLSKITGYKINIYKNQLYFYIVANEQSKNKIKKTIPFIVMPKRIKNLEIKLTKEVRIYSLPHRKLQNNLE